MCDCLKRGRRLIGADPDWLSIDRSIHRRLIHVSLLFFSLLPAPLASSDGTPQFHCWCWWCPCCRCWSIRCCFLLLLIRNYYDNLLNNPIVGGFESKRKQSMQTACCCCPHRCSCEISLGCSRFACCRPIGVCCSRCWRCYWSGTVRVDPIDAADQTNAADQFFAVSQQSEKNRRSAPLKKRVNAHVLIVGCDWLDCLSIVKVWDWP